MDYLAASEDVPHGHLALDFEAHNDEASVEGPVDGGHLGLALGLVSRLELDDLAEVGVPLAEQGLAVALVLRLLREHEVVLEVGIVEAAEVRELVHVLVHRQVVLVVVDAEAADDLLRHEVHHQDVRVLAPHSNKRALGVELGDLCVDAREDHRGVVREHDLVGLQLVYLMVH